MLIARHRSPSLVAALTVEASYIDWATVWVASLAAVCMSGQLLQLLLGQRGQVLGALNNRLLNNLLLDNGTAEGLSNGNRTSYGTSHGQRGNGTSWCGCRILDVNVFRFGCCNVLGIGSLCRRVGQLCASSKANERQSDEHEEFLCRKQEQIFNLKYTFKSQLAVDLFLAAIAPGREWNAWEWHSSLSAGNEVVHLTRRHLNWLFLRVVFVFLLFFSVFTFISRSCISFLTLVHLLSLEGSHTILIICRLLGFVLGWR